MGYACPVCGVTQADGEHLANHLAFTALLHGDGHEAWLDEHVPDWADRDPDALADAVTDLADGAEYHAVFEDTTGTGGNARGGTVEDALAAAAADGRAPVDDEVKRVIREAREMTERMRDDGEE